MNPDSEDRQLGEYRLKELVSENELSITWLAEQVSVSRRVLVDELRPENADQQEVFLANVRAKAAVEQPLVGAVYEAVAESGLCFFAHELLPGASLKQRERAGEPFKPIRLAHVLRRISEAQIQYQTLGQATAPLGLQNIYVDSQDVIRLDNLAIAGPRTPEQSTRDIVKLGHALPALLADGQPGTTRSQTLLAWMRGEGLDAPLTWEQVLKFCNQIEQQLVSPTPTAPQTQAQDSRKKPPIITITVAGACALVAILALALRMRPDLPVSPPLPPLPNSMLIPGGLHPTPDGSQQNLQPFRISPHEVTIGQYAGFLETLETLAKGGQDRTFDHKDQPQEKSSHLPADWSALFAAAKAGETWNDLPVTLDSPLVGVDWWDAAAYAEWKRARLPTQEEWFAALRKGVEDPSTISTSSWMPVRSNTTDRTPRGLIGMAGSVCEWTGSQAPNPVNPLGERKWVIIGGSYLKPGSNALTREWSDQRTLRRPDLGFRLVFEVD